MVADEGFVRFRAVQDNRDPGWGVWSLTDRHADRADQCAYRYEKSGDRYEEFSDPAHVVTLVDPVRWRLRDGRVSIGGSCGR